MVHFSIFGGNEGQLTAGGAVYVNILGGASLRRPPVATRLLELARAGPTDSRTRYFFISVFGGLSIRWPTLAEEYLALLEALRSGLIRLEEWDRVMVGPGADPLGRTGSLSLFGSIDTDALPTEEEELDALSLQRHSGTIPQPAVERLILAIGQRGAPRLTAVRQAAVATLAAAAGVPPAV